MEIPKHPIFPIQINVHNLMMVPEDVPPRLVTVFNENGERVYLGSDSWYCESSYEKLKEPPKLWYDIPKFDVDRIELEKLSKEELIDLIIKERRDK